MPVKSRPVQSKYPPRTFQNLIDFARDHGFLSEEDPPFGGQTQRRIVEFVLKIDTDPEIKALKACKGRNTLDLIQEAVHQLTSSEAEE